MWSREEWRSWEMEREKEKKLRRGGGRCDRVVEKKKERT